ncbi:MAG: hypothetical protein ACOX6U_06790 [Oscillospiraceae bacterium]|jgi:cation transport ATPase
MSDKKQYSVDDILADLSLERDTGRGTKPNPSVDVDRLIAEILGEEKPPVRTPEPVQTKTEPPAAVREAESTPVSVGQTAQQKPKFTVNIRYDDEPAAPKEPRREYTIQPQAPAAPELPVKEPTLSTVDLLKESLADELGVSAPAEPEPMDAAPAGDEIQAPWADSGELAEGEAQAEVLSESAAEETARPEAAAVETSAPKIQAAYDDAGAPVDEPTRYIDEDAFLKAKQRADTPVPQEKEEGAESEPEEEELDYVEYRSPADEREVYTEILTTRKRLLLSVILLAVFGGLALVFALGQEFFPQLLPSALRRNEQPLIYLVVQFVLLVSSMMVCCSSLGEGLLSAVRLHPNRDSLVSLAALFSLVQMVVSFFRIEAVTAPSVHLYGLVVIGALLCNSFAKYFAINRMILNFRIVSSGYDKYVTTLVEDENVALELTRGVVSDVPTVAVQQKADFVTDFIGYSIDTDATDEYAKYLTPLAVGFAVLLGVVSFFMTRNTDTALTTAAAVLCVFSPFSYLFSVGLPMSRAVRKYNKHGGVILSPSEVDDFCYTNAVAVSAHDLFPGNAVKLYGIKTFAGQRIDEALMDAASVIEASGSVLANVFHQITSGDSKLLRPVDTLVYEDGMGISAWVDNKRVLIGSRDLMINHGISVPSRDYEERYLNEGHDLIYLSTSGELTAVFLTKFFAAPEVKAYIRRLEDNGIRLIVKSVDAVITQQKLAEVFDEDPSFFKILPARLHATYDALTAPAERGTSSVLSNGSFRSFAGSLIAAKRMKSAILLGSIIQFAAIGLGVLMLIALTLVSGMSEMKVLSLLVYELVWLVATFLIPRLKTL